MEARSQSSSRTALRMPRRAKQRGLKPHRVTHAEGPLIILPESGPHFAGDLLRQLLRHLGTDRIRTAAAPSRTLFTTFTALLGRGCRGDGGGSWAAAAVLGVVNLKG